MSGAAPFFWRQPIRYWRWSSRERPAIFWSCIIAAIAPVTLVAVPPIRHALGDPDAKPVPTTYPSTDPCFLFPLFLWGRSPRVCVFVIAITD